MSTPKQIEANRRNAQKSTGPRSVAGKAVSSQNALKSGIDAETECIYGEDPEHLEELKRQYLARFQPITPEERSYVDTLIRCDWRQRRFARIDAEILEHEMDTAFHPSKTAPAGQAFALVHTQMARLQRRIEQTERSYKSALHELERLQQSRELPEPEPPPQLQPVANQPTSPQIGFVPQTVGQAFRPAAALPGGAEPYRSPQAPEAPIHPAKGPEGTRGESRAPIVRTSCDAPRRQPAIPSTSSAREPKGRRGAPDPNEAQRR